MSNNAAILQRTKDECKDSTNAYATQRQNFINDICKEISVNQNFHWLEVSSTVSYTGDWVAIPAEVGKLMAAGVGGKPLTRLTESDYFKRKYELTQNIVGDMKGYYRFRWNSTGKLFEILPVNVNSGTTIDILYRKFLSVPDQFPDYFDEVIVCGVLWKFMAFLEGDDLDVAQFQKIRYMELVNELTGIWNPEVETDEASRIMTQEELDWEHALEYYNR